MQLKQSDIIRDFHVPKYVIEGQSVELHCGLNREDWASLHSLLWYKVSSFQPYIVSIAEKYYEMNNK